MKCALVLAGGAIAAILAGCVTVGGGEVRDPRVTKLIPGETTTAQAHQRLGRPDEVNQHKADGMAFDVLTYRSAKANLLTAFSRAPDPRFRVVVLEFDRGILNAFHLVRNARKHRPLDAAASKVFRSRDVEQAAVLRALGGPSGEGFCPSTILPCRPEWGRGARVWVWSSVGGVVDRLSLVAAAWDRSGRLIDCAIAEAVSDEEKKVRDRSPPSVCRPL